MPVLAASDPLPRRPRRVLVAGTSGSGKTMLAGRIGEALAIPHVEIDALFHGPGWTPREEFEAEVAAFSAQPEWVTEWNFHAVRALLAQRADTLVWLDLPRRTVMRQVVRRTLRRWRRREMLWNGNVEPPLRTIFRNREHIVRWAWRTHDQTARRVAALVDERPQLVIVRLRSRRDVRRWLTGPLPDSAVTSAAPARQSRRR